jgi:phage-related protein
MRTVLLYKRYFLDFYEAQSEDVQEKIAWTLDLICELPRVPEKYFKHIESTEGLFEIRVQMGSNIFRIFCFFDKGNLIILGNAFQKKDQKTPKNEIKLALKIMQEYFDEK